MKNDTELHNNMSRSFAIISLILYALTLCTFIYKNKTGYTSVSKEKTYTNCRVETAGEESPFGVDNIYYIRAYERTDSDDTAEDQDGDDKGKLLYESKVSWSHLEHFLDYKDKELTVYKTASGRTFPVYMVNADAKEAELEYRKISSPTIWYVLYFIGAMLGTVCLINSRRLAKVAANYKNESYTFVPEVSTKYTDNRAAAFYNEISRSAIRKDPDEPRTTLNSTVTQFENEVFSDRVRSYDNSGELMENRSAQVRKFERSMVRSNLTAAIIIILIVAVVAAAKSINGYTKVEYYETYDDCKITTEANGSGKSRHYKLTISQRKTAEVNYDFNKMHESKEGFENFNYDELAPEDEYVELYSHNVSARCYEYFRTYSSPKVTMFRTSWGSIFPVGKVNCTPAEAERFYRMIDPPYHWYIAYIIGIVISLALIKMALSSKKTADNYKAGNEYIMPERFSSTGEALAAMEHMRLRRERDMKRFKRPR